MRLESLLVADRPRPQLPWLLVAASALLLVIVLYLFFAAYLPAKQRLAGLEAELKQVYTREADLQTKLAQQEKTYALREQQGTALTAERDALARRIEELEKELAAARGRKR
jgi:septal ring factor EnvC (AmiA/AmiB activator)